MMADSLCDQSIDEGAKLYNRGRYKEALEYFEYANKRCPSNVTANWVSKCKTAIANASKKSSNQSSSSTYSSSSSQSPQPSTSTPASLKVSTQHINFTSSGGTLSTYITCNKDWGFTYLYKDANHTNRSYDFEVKREGNLLLITCQSNQVSYTKNAQFDVFVRENSKIRYTIYISQAAGTTYYYINASANSTVFPAEGGTIKITVQSNTSWYVDSKSSWLGYKNKTNNSVEVYCMKNNEQYELSGNIVLRTTFGDKTTSVNFKQNRAWKADSYQPYKPYNRYNIWWDNLEWEYEVTWAQAGVSLGYPINFDISALDFRLYWFEFSLANFGYQSNVKWSNWYWQPNVKFYIPLDFDWAMTISAGPKLNFFNQEDFYYYDYKTGNYYLPNDVKQLDWLGMNKKWWFNAQLGVRWDWSEYFGSEFFIRYNGCVAIGATINVHTGF